MNIKIAAVTDDDKTISQHFGRAKHYAVLTIEDGEIISREQREKMGHSHFAAEHHDHEQADPRGHGFSAAEQDRHFLMADAIRDCQILLARGMGAGAYHSMEQIGIRPVLTDMDRIDQAALEVALGTIVEHKELLH